MVRRSGTVNPVNWKIVVGVRIPFGANVWIGGRRGIGTGLKSQISWFNSNPIQLVRSFNSRTPHCHCGNTGALPVRTAIYKNALYGAWYCSLPHCVPYKYVVLFIWYIHAGKVITQSTVCKYASVIKWLDGGLQSRVRWFDSSQMLIYIRRFFLHLKITMLLL